MIDVVNLYFKIEVTAIAIRPGIIRENERNEKSDRQKSQYKKAKRVLIQTTNIIKHANLSRIARRPN